MTDSLKKILVPLDGSALAIKALGHVQAFGSIGAAELRLVRVLPERDLDPSSPEHYGDAQRALQALEDELEGKAAKVHGQILFGDPAEKILEAAAGFQPDLIAMTTHGRSGVERLVRGSVAEKILRHATAPVLLANPFATATRFEKILVPLDGSSLAASILPLAARIAREHGAKVVLFHAVERGESGAEAFVTRTEAKDLLTRYERFFKGVRVEVLLAGKQAPAVEILDAIAHVKADLVILSTHGRTGLARWFMGSVAEQVLRECRCPVLVRRALTTTPDGMLHVRDAARAKLGKKKQRA